MFDDEADFAAEHFAFEFTDARQVELIDELRVNAPLDVFEFELLILLGQGGWGIGKFRHG